MTPLKLAPFRVDGQWQTEWKGSTKYGLKVDDLNGDEFPEVLSFHGVDFPQPILSWRTKDWYWRKQKLHGSSLACYIESWLRYPGARVFPVFTAFVRWEGKKWTVTVWRDGFVQAVTVK